MDQLRTFLLEGRDGAWTGRFAGEACVLENLPGQGEARGAGRRLQSTIAWVTRLRSSMR